jgi:uncharacterized protein (TIGR02118 family)
MLKVCTLFQRKKGLSVAEYQSYWRSGHPEFVKRLPGVRRYAQNHPLPETFDGDAPVYDGVVELYFDDSAALKHLSTTQEYQDLNADEERFVDRSTIRLVFTEEHILKEGERKDGAIKRITFFKRASGISPEEFQERWLAEYGHGVASSRDVIRYSACAARLNGYRDGREPAWDGIDMASFASFDAARRDDHLGQLEGLASTLDLPRMYTRENRVIG